MRETVTGVKLKPTSEVFNTRKEAQEYAEQTGSYAAECREYDDVTGEFMGWKFYVPK